ncbi:uncharacterized protein METZ01_LOCUS332502, partial [marine metagenome]
EAALLKYGQRSFMPVPICTHNFYGQSQKH